MRSSLNGGLKAKAKDGASKKNLMPSSTFLATKRAPYTYITELDGAPVALYRPSYAQVDRDLTQTHLEEPLDRSNLDKRSATKIQPTCLEQARYCSLEAR